MMIGICGGIGSGKSVASRILRLRGEAVYDCDLEAKRIMDGSEEVLSALNVRYGDAVCPKDGPICRPELAKRVFGSDEERLWLNSLVHRLVREDVASWRDEKLSEGHRRCFVESAILASSGLAQMCDEIWLVTASEEVRIERIKMRDSIDEEAIYKRMLSQKEEERLIATLGIPVNTIDNSGDVSILDQID
ncbi:MAG: dephospho-CoA kinase [Muribaculaceae bacterium]|nr:dephospho-CoA kinase [Muribaculaceae bacterium]